MKDWVYIRGLRVKDWVYIRRFLTASIPKGTPHPYTQKEKTHTHTHTHTGVFFVF